MSKISKSPVPRMLWLFGLMTVLGMLGLPSTILAQQPPLRQLVEVRTRLGTMVVALYNETPEHRDRFISRVKAHEMDSLLFHRVVPGLGIEGGDPASKNAAPGIPLGLDADSIGLPLTVVPGMIHRKAVLTASPAGDGPELARRSHRDLFLIVLGVPYESSELDRVAARNTALGAPFTYSEQDRRIYASVGGQPRLDGSYTVFGEVVDGLEVIDAIAASPCNTWDRPMEDIRMYMRLLP